MKTPLFNAMAALALASTITACATVRQASAPDATCTALAAQIAVAEHDLESAVQASNNAWTAVIPAAVALKYAKGQADAGAAKDHIRSLRTQSDALGCLKAA